MSRKMAWIARIDNVEKHPNADSLDICTIGGWKVVTKFGEFNTGQLAVYFSIDSWIPYELAPFLSKDRLEPREFEGVKGERLRTIRLRGQISQGLLLPLEPTCSNIESILMEDLDVTEPLGILKYERPMPTQLAGLAKGNFPSFIPKTDEERIQNLKKEMDQWSQSFDQWEITEKLDGSSMTVYYRNDRDDESQSFGVCSRNLELKETEGNSFWIAARKYELEQKLKALDMCIAIQGELVGPGIQGNKYKLTDIDFYVFTIYNIVDGVYLESKDRLQLCEILGLKHVPVIVTLSLINYNIDVLLTLAEGKSKINTNTEREGIVFKNIQNPQLHFKAISNKFLIKNGDD